MRGLIAALAFFAGGSAHAQSFLTTNGRLSFSAYVEEDVRLGVPADGPSFIERSRTIGSARIESKPVPHLRALFDGRFLATVESRDETPRNPLRNDVDALFVEVDRPFAAPIRLRAGRQTIRWGSGLLFNPTSVLNPPDLEDPLRYGAPLGNDMVRLEVLGDFHLDAILVPRFRAAFLPALDERAALAASGVPAAVLIANDPAWTVDVTPAFDEPHDPEGAIRISGKLPTADVDAALVGYRGHLPVPQLESASLDADFSAKTLAGTAHLFYPAYDLTGIDVASQLPLGPFGDAGAWLEAAWVMPKAYLREVVANGSLTRTYELQQPYARVATGLDHTTAGGLYTNLQFVRGFPEEVGKAAQGDYLVLVIERPFLRERLHLRIVSSLDLDDRSALAAPEISVTTNGVSLAVGAWRGTGGRDTKFGGDLTGPPVVYARARASF